MKAQKWLAASLMAAVLLAGCTSAPADQSSAATALDNSSRTAVEPFEWDDVFGAEAPKYLDSSVREADEPFEWGDVYDS